MCDEVSSTASPPHTTSTTWSGPCPPLQQRPPSLTPSPRRPAAASARP
jgi:hypothetical protein